MKDILYETVPCWYKLGWNSSDSSLKIQIAESFIEALPPIPSDSPLVQQTQEDLSDSCHSFCGDLNNPTFGFNHAIRRGEQEPGDNFIPFMVSFSSLSRGSSDDYFLDGLYAAAGSVQLIFSVLGNISDKDAPRNLPGGIPQLITIDDIDLGSVNKDCSLRGKLTRDGFALLDRLVCAEADMAAIERRVTSALKEAWQTIANEDIGLSYVKAVFRNNPTGFVLCCRGQVPRLYTVPDFNRAQRGLRINCRNIDNPAQLLTFFAGLAVLYEELEKESMK